MNLTDARHADVAKGREFIEHLLTWFEDNGRHDLPWRKTKDPWHTLIAPLLLRKTTTRQVATIYKSFISKFPTPEALASSNVNEVERVLRPLGMEHTRSVRMVELAEKIVKLHRGAVPSTLKELKELPLVGDYTAREVLCVAFGRDEPMLDRNMIRILQRMFSVRSERERPHTDPEIWKIAENLMPKGRAREFNYAVMDFAHKMCKARRPLCPTCPMRYICNYASKALSRGQARKG